MSASGDSPPGRPSWGLGDVAIGIFANLVLTIVVGGAIAVAAGWIPVGGVGSATGSAVAQTQLGTEVTPYLGDRPPIWGLALLQVPLWAGYLGAVVVAGRVKGGGVASDFGFSARLLDAPIGLVAGIVTQLLVLPLLYLPIFSLTGADADDLSRPARQLSSTAASAPSWLLFALVVGIGAPLVEELFFRGLLLRSLTKRGMGDVGAVLVSSAVFAAIHIQLLQFPGLMAFGVVAGVFAVRTGRLGGAIWAHIGFNMTTVVALYLAS